MRILAIGGAMILALVGAVPASAQSDFEREVLRRLERLERRLDDLERDRGREERRRDRDSDYSRPYSEQPRNEVVAAVSLLCGANCGMAAQSYCRSTGFRNGVAITIEKRGAFDHVTRARCFN
jgi:hypothetical protein